MIHLFHGFLGSPEDFMFLQREDLLLHDLYQIKKEDILTQIQEGDTLVGYSMGGRIAMEIFTQIPEKINKLILINAHPGLESDEEKKLRQSWEDEIQIKLRNLPQEEFLSFWNKLPIFTGDSPLSPIKDQRFKDSLQLFDENRLSQQKNFLPLLLPYRQKVLWIIGNQDKKYLALAQTRLLPNGFSCLMMEGGHRLFQKKNELKKLLDKEI